MQRNTLTIWMKRKQFVVMKAEVGASNIISKAQRNKAQRSFQPVKAQRKMRNLIFLISEAQLPL